MFRNILCMATLAMVICGSANAASSIIVAASNSSPESKKRADIVCTGKDDQVKILAAFTRAKKFKADFDRNPGDMKSVTCYGKHSIELIPGDYNLSGTLVIPPAADCFIKADGAEFHYLPKTGDAVVLQGMLRCGYSFGVIKSDSTGAVLKIKPDATMPSLSSDIFMRALIGSGQKGTGFYIDPSVENVCINRIEGIDIYGFDSGVKVGDAPYDPGTFTGKGKSDGNWYWFSNVRRCNTCYLVAGQGVDSNVWNINIDASIDGSVGLRTRELFGKYYLIIGTWRHEGVNKALILDPGARSNIIEMQPPLKQWNWEDNSGNDTNAIISWTEMMPPKPGVRRK